LKGTDILITGGYGTVGRRIAADLAPFYSGRVVVAGRSAEKAAQLTAELGHGVRSRRVNVGDLGSVEAALESVGLVMSCIDQPEPHLLRAAIARGLAFPAAILRLATALLRTRYSSASSILTRLNGRIGTSYDEERHYVANSADAPHRRPTRPLFTKVCGRGILRTSPLRSSEKFAQPWSNTNDALTQS
jgi:hypothetical protein